MGFTRDDQTHRLLVKETGLHKLTKEQREIMAKIDGDVNLELLEGSDDDPTPTLELPTLAQRGA